MRKTIPASLINRAEKIIKKGRETKHCPVAMFPRLVSVDEWGDLATKMQCILKDNIKRDEAPDYGNLPKLELVPSGKPRLGSC